MRPFCHHVLSADRDIAAARLIAPAVVQIALQGQAIAHRRVPIETKPALSHVPVVRGIQAIGEQRSVASKALSVEPKIRAGAKRAAVAGCSKTLQLCSASAHQRESRSVLRFLSNDVDHAIDRVRAPQGRPRAADDLDPIDLREGNILRVPKHAREQRRVHRPAIDQDQELIGGRAVEPPRADSPLSRIDLRDLQIRGESQCFRKTGSA